MKSITNHHHQITNINNNLCSDWLEYLDVADKTKQTYTRAIKQFMEYLQANQITQPTRADIVEYKNKLLTSKSINTVNSYLVAVKQFFNWLDMNGLYKNISKGIKPIKNTSDFKKDYLTIGQVKRVLANINTKTIKGQRDYIIILLMVTSGLRVSEIKDINVSDIKLKNGNKVIYIKGKGRTDKSDYIKLSDEVDNLISEYIELSELNEDNPLFTSLATNYKGQRLSDRSISKIVKTEFKKNNLDSDKLTAHSLRHTSAVINLLSGGSLEDTRQLLRHSNISTTQIYSHQIEKDNNQASQRITSVLLTV